MNGAAQAALPRAILGIDLGTSHTAVGWAPCQAGAQPETVLLSQWVVGRRRAASPLLPSVLYAAPTGELPRLERASSAGWIAGEYARVRSQETRGRAISSSKSWLCHAGVDRLGPILPWGGEEPEVAKLSPVDVAQRLLEQVSRNFAEQHPELEPADVSLVLTVPASFDETARKLTLLAAERAGLRVRLLEEPQAACYEYLGQASNELLRLVQRRGALRVLVCDVGGGTTDLSLIEAEERNGSLELRRSAVGRHLLLGGDNMDLAVARLAESKLGETPLPPERFGQLLLAAQSAKEALLSEHSPASFPVRVLGLGSALVGSTLSVDLSAREVRGLVLDGFFPLTARGELPKARRSGLVTFGLPYERDPAITRHIAEFLERHAGLGFPEALLLNGGVMQSAAIQQRLLECFAGWGAGEVTLLAAPDPLLAVSRGAVRYGLSLHGFGPRIAGGAAHGYYVGVEGPGALGRQALCIVPRGSREGERHVLAQRFDLVVGRPARFELYASDTALHPPGASVLVDSNFQALPPVTSLLASSGTEADAQVRVELDGELSAVGTLELGCTVIDVPGARSRARDDEPTPRRFSLAFELTPRPSAAPSPSRGKTVGLDAARFAAAEESLLRVFGKGRKDVSEREVKDLRGALEHALGPRKTWDLELHRRLVDVLLAARKGRARSADHERVFWMLIGYCLRPGFGHRLDAERVQLLWHAFEPGLMHREQERVWQQYWIAWRRIAGGLDSGQQASVRELLDPLLAPAELKLKKAKNLRPFAPDEVLALASQLERVAGPGRSELGRWILERTWHDRDPRLWTHLGRVGARVPAYASAHFALRGGIVERWVEQLLRERWAEVNTAAASAFSLARVTGDPVRDLSPKLRADVAAALTRVGAPDMWQRAVLEFMPVSEAERAEQLDADLPLGLRLVEP